MKLKCEKKILIDNISLVQKGVTSKSPVAVLDCFLLICDDDGFRMISTDTEIGIKTGNISCEIIEKGSIALPSKFFSEIIRRLPDGNVTIDVKDRFVTVIKCKQSEFKIIGRNSEEYPELPDVDRNEEYRISQGFFKSLIRQTIFSTCQDESRPNFMGALLEIQDGEMTMVTCDSFRVSYIHKKADISAELYNKVIIPSKTINELYKLLSDEDDEMSVFITEKHALFDLNSCIMVSRLIEGEFLNYKNVFPDEFETKIIADKYELETALSRSVLVSFQENKKIPVKFNISDNKLVIVTGADLGNSYDEIDVDFNGKELEISFNPKFLLDAVEAINEEKVLIEFNSMLSPCVVRPVENLCYKYLILPLKIRS